MNQILTIDGQKYELVTIIEGVGAGDGPSPLGLRPISDKKLEADSKDGVNQMLEGFDMGFERGVIFGLRKSLAHLDSQPDIDAVKRLIIERLKALDKENK
jgi:hypothetical protein